MASLVLQNVSVSYRVRDRSKSASLGLVKQHVTGGILQASQKYVDVLALHDVSVKLQDGDRLGLLGHNGAGKSTLLRVMSGILPPTAGRVRIEGNLSPLLSIQLGLNNQATGFENIFIRARYMGVPEREIRAQAEEICAFSELGDYIHLPLDSYSSGMRLRLAFAIATAFSPDILVLDEWLSAGDAKFQSKATKRLHSLIDRTGIFVMASHNPNLIKRVCNLGIVLNQGRLIYLGPIDRAVDLYKELDAVPARNVATPEAMFRQRVSDLQKINGALEAYFQDNGCYPSTDDNWVSVVQQQSEEWLPDLVPDYLESIPRDPASSWDFDDPQYCYRSNGSGYKLIARKSGDADRLTAELQVRKDPKRSTGRAVWAYGFWTMDYTNK